MFLNRSTITWGGFTALACASIFFCYNYFHIAYPLVDIPISIDRNQALELSKDLGKNYQWPLVGTQTAIVFSTEQQDALIQPYADLKTGGNNNYRAMLQAGFYCPYKWIVRFFKEHQTDELFVRLTPDGKPYGFTHTMPEDKELPNLTQDAARTLAQEQVTTVWHVDLTDYKEIEVSHTTTPKGRIDHTFVYERTNATLLTEGKYRVQIKVSGNQLTEVTRLVKIPETFARHYESLASKNNLLASIATFLMYFLYIIGGCLIGGYFLFKRNMLFARHAFIWASGIALLQAAMTFNNLPLVWMQYRTSLSASSFLTSYSLGALFQALYSLAYCVFAFTIAVSLDNWAFPNHVRFWSSWSQKIGSSYTILGQTVGGYLGAITFFGTATATYLLFLQVFNWWAPASALMDPNTIATPLPWLSAFAISLQAGFVEECLFRAIPLAGAVILGRYLGKEKLLLTLGFIIQVFVFSAAHANYIQQPFYFRLLELLLPSALFGLVYLMYGLLPGIICHFIYDLIAVGIPLVISNAPSALPHKIMLYTIGCIPLFVVLYQRMRRGSWTTLTKDDYNQGEQPYVHDTQEQYVSGPVITKHLSKPTMVTLSILAGVSVALLFFCAQEKYQAPLMTVNRTQAIEIARQAVPEDFIFKTNNTVLTQLYARVAPEHIFVWQTSGKEAYNRLLGVYLTPPTWLVRFVSFTAPEDSRAEEYKVCVGPDGNVRRQLLIIPEQKALPSVDKAAARTLSLNAVKNRYEYTPDMLEEISAQPIDRPNRTDWIFTFKHLPTQLTEGYAQIAVTIAGNTVQDIYRSVFVPEAWKRAHEHRENIKNNISMITGLLFVLLIIIAISACGTSFLRTLNMKLILLLGTVLFLASLLVIANSIPAITGFFSTARPFSTQLFTMLIGTILFTLLRIIIVSVYSIHLDQLINRSRIINSTVFGVGLLAGLIIRAAHVFGIWLAPAHVPVWGSYDFLSSYNAAGMILLAYLFMILRNATFGTITIGFLNNLKNTTSNKIFRFFFIFIAVYAAIGSFETIASGVAIGLSITVVILLMYHLLLCHDSSLWIPVLTGYFATYACGEYNAGVFNGYGTSMVITAGVLIALNYYWFLQLRKKA